MGVSEHDALAAPADVVVLELRIGARAVEEDGGRLAAWMTDVDEVVSEDRGARAVTDDDAVGHGRIRPAITGPDDEALGENELGAWSLDDDGGVLKVLEARLRDVRKTDLGPRRLTDVQGDESLTRADRLRAHCPEDRVAHGDPGILQDVDPSQAAGQPRPPHLEVLDLQADPPPLDGDDGRGVGRRLEHRRELRELRPGQGQGPLHRQLLGERSERGLHDQAGGIVDRRLDRGVGLARPHLAGPGQDGRQGRADHGAQREGGKRDRETVSHQFSHHNTSSFSLLFSGSRYLPTP